MLRPTGRDVRDGGTAALILPRSALLSGQSLPRLCDRRHTTGPVNLLWSQKPKIGPNPRQEIANAETDASSLRVCGSRREPLVTRSSREEERRRPQVNCAATAAAVIAVRRSTFEGPRRCQPFGIPLALARPSLGAILDTYCVSSYASAMLSMGRTRLMER